MVTGGGWPRQYICLPTRVGSLARPPLPGGAAHLDSLTGKDYIDAYVKLAEFVIPKLQRTALAAAEANRRIEVMMNLSDPWQSLSNRLTAVRLGE